MNQVSFANLDSSINNDVDIANRYAIADEDLYSDPNESKADL